MNDLSDLLIANLYKENFNHLITLSELASSAKKIEIICPFISDFGGEWIENLLREGKEVTLLTEISARAVMQNVMSVSALKKITSSGGKVFFKTKNLHAKLYWFDRKTIVITSANLTENGLRSNLEVGAVLQPGIFNSSILKDSNLNFSSHIAAYWTVFMKGSEALTSERICELEEWQLNNAEASKKYLELKNELDEIFESNEYFPFQRKLENKQNIRTDLFATNQFKGFREDQWDVFDHEMELNAENLEIFRHSLDSKINPILGSLFNQLKSEPIFSENLSALHRGYSQNMMLKKRFPNDRYLFLTKAEKGKLAKQHVKHPSFVIGMGKDLGGTSKWLEIRCGVEEEFVNELTPYGSNLLTQIRKNSDEVMKVFEKLKGDWTLTHGKHSEGKRIEINISKLSKTNLVEICNSYLADQTVSDLQIRRKYRWENLEDKNLLLDSRITHNLAEDLVHLTYFFKLAHQK